MTIADTNDAYRKLLTLENRERKGTRVRLTSGVLATELPINKILSRIADFDDFNEQTDIDNEHAFGRFDLQGVDICWNIDYFDKFQDNPSPDKYDKGKTCRVFTVMLCEEIQAQG